MPAVQSIWKSNKREYIKTTTPCTNCGGQYMFGTPRGEVPLNKDGKPCKHSYRGTGKGTYSVSYCIHCNDKLTTDSGD